MLNLRKAVPKYVPLILSLVRELAAYERESNGVIATSSDLLRDGFSARRKFQVIIAEWMVDLLGWPCSFAIIQRGTVVKESSSRIWSSGNGFEAEG